MNVQNAVNTCINIGTVGSEKVNLEILQFKTCKEHQANVRFVPVFWLLFSAVIKTWFTTSSSLFPFPQLWNKALQTLWLPSHTSLWNQIPPHHFNIHSQLLFSSAIENTLKTCFEEMLWFKWIFGFKWFKLDFLSLILIVIIWNKRRIKNQTGLKIFYTKIGLSIRLEVSGLSCRCLASIREHYEK